MATRGVGGLTYVDNRVKYSLSTKQHLVNHSCQSTFIKNDFLFCLFSVVESEDVCSTSKKSRVVLHPKDTQHVTRILYVAGIVRYIHVVW